MLGRSSGKHYREVVDFLLGIPNEKYVSSKTPSTRSRRLLIVKVAIACVEEGKQMPSTVFEEKWCRTCKHFAAPSTRVGRVGRNLSQRKRFTICCVEAVCGRISKGPYGGTLNATIGAHLRSARRCNFRGSFSAVHRHRLQRSIRICGSKTTEIVNTNGIF